MMIEATLGEVGKPAAFHFRKFWGFHNQVLVSLDDMPACDRAEPLIVTRTFLKGILTHDWNATNNPPSKERLEKFNAELRKLLYKTTCEEFEYFADY